MSQIPSQQGAPGPAFTRCRSLLEVFSSVPDPRRKEGRRYRLDSLLALAVAAMLCGYRTYGAIAEWTRHYGEDLSASLGIPKGRVPCAATFFHAFRRLDRAALERELARWAQEICAASGTEWSESPQPNESPPARRVAIDGKTLRGTAKQGAPGAHLLSAVEHGLGLTLGQVAVDDKTNEITAVQEVLDGLVLRGHVITVDALLTQKAIARKIIEKGGTT